MPPKKKKVAAQCREQRKREKREWEETRLRTVSASDPELMDTSTSADSCCNDLTVEKILGWSTGEPEMAAGPLAASPEEVQERLLWSMSRSGLSYTPAPPSMLRS